MDKDHYEAIILGCAGMADLPSSLSEMGIKLEDVEPSAIIAEKDHTNATNPRLVTSADYVKLIRNAL